MHGQAATRVGARSAGKARRRRAARASEGLSAARRASLRSRGLSKNGEPSPVAATIPGPGAVSARTAGRAQEGAAGAGTACVALDRRRSVQAVPRQRRFEPVYVMEELTGCTTRFPPTTRARGGASRPAAEADATLAPYTPVVDSYYACEAAATAAAPEDAGSAQARLGGRQSQEGAAALALLTPKSGLKSRDYDTNTSARAAA